MTIDFTEKGDAVLRIESDVIPKAGETISMMVPKKEYTVISVDYLLKNKLAIGEEWILNIVTIEVESK